ncbi:S-adenosylmethionine:tRNA ribosyltransferase-isomerase-like protein [hydrothermal vent metagenome]|uniref:S-adenosylmethionine:tRNA ribosyltransferase-isomerase-like protein n=1 Tax=hydrothermal vent metagenome TaxID=652676 RepID=A0A3B0VH29_9ZZZZ
MPKLPALDFVLPSALEASEPPEAQGLARDQVRLMVSNYGSDCIRHTQFRQIGQFLQRGDLLVINSSGTMNAALPATLSNGTELLLHLSTQLPAGLWSVELRRPLQNSSQPYSQGKAGMVLGLPDGGSVRLLTPHNPTQRYPSNQDVRLWLATVALPQPLFAYLKAHGRPIRYSYVPDPWPLDYYQTVFANAPGSAEMPSAGRAFTADLITQLVAQGVQIAPLVLHTGVASLEDHEPPYEEYYELSGQTAVQVNLARQQGRRIVAVGTTVIRALETVTDEDGLTHAGAGWTDLFIIPQRGLRAVNGLLTGMHEPRATHLAMLAALAGMGHLSVAYEQALQHRYLWHEFGDLHLLLP